MPKYEALIGVEEPHAAWGDNPEHHFNLVTYHRAYQAKYDKAALSRARKEKQEIKDYFTRKIYTEAIVDTTRKLSHRIVYKRGTQNEIQQTS